MALSDYAGPYPGFLLGVCDPPPPPPPLDNHDLFFIDSRGMGLLCLAKHQEKHCKHNIKTLMRVSIYLLQLIIGLSRIHHGYTGLVLGCTCVYDSVHINGDVTVDKHKTQITQPITTEGALCCVSGMVLGRRVSEGCCCNFSRQKASSASVVIGEGRSFLYVSMNSCRFCWDSEMP